MSLKMKHKISEHKIENFLQIFDRSILHSIGNCFWIVFCLTLTSAVFYAFVCHSTILVKNFYFSLEMSQVSSQQRSLSVWSNCCSINLELKSLEKSWVKSIFLTQRCRTYPPLKVAFCIEAPLKENDFCKLTHSTKADVKFKLSEKQPRKIGSTSTRNGPIKAPFKSCPWLHIERYKMKGRLDKK